MSKYITDVCSQTLFQSDCGKLCTPVKIFCRNYKQPRKIKKPKKQVYYGFVNELFIKKEKELEENLTEDVPDYWNELFRYVDYCLVFM